MTMICNCFSPRPKEHGQSRDMFCTKCGNWWMPEHGSNPVAEHTIEIPVSDVSSASNCYHDGMRSIVPADWEPPVKRGFREPSHRHGQRHAKPKRQRRK